MRRFSVSVTFTLATLFGIATSSAESVAPPAPPRGVETERAVDPRTSVRAGRVEEYSVPSASLHRERRVWVYTPPGYTARADSSYDLLVAFDGNDYLSEIPLPMVLDTLLAAGQAPPFVALLIDNATSTLRLEDLANRARFAAYLGEELIPWVRHHWSVTRDPHRTIVTGSSAGGLAAAYVALKRPDLFGNVLSQSGAFWRGNEASNDPPYEWLTAQYGAAPRRDIRFFLDVGALEARGALGGSAPSILEANRRLRDALRAKGYNVAYTEVPGGGHAPQFWRQRLPSGIVALAAPTTGR
jgi:enterochelin esterase family protein